LYEFSVLEESFQVLHPSAPRTKQTAHSQEYYELLFSAKLVDASTRVVGVSYLDVGTATYNRNDAYSSIG
jgi:hypothetical protein